MNALVPASAGLAVFDFEGHAVKTFNRSGNPGVILADVCRVLGIANVSHAASRLDSGEKDTVVINDSVGRPHQHIIINESGLYSLIMSSRKPAAKRFKKWVTAEVLPAIRKTGGYMVAAPDETEEELMLRAMTVLQATVQRQRLQVVAAEARADTAEEAAQASEAALDNLASTDGSFSLRDAAKTVGMQETAFHSGRRLERLRPAHQKRDFGNEGYTLL